MDKPPATSIRIAALQWDIQQGKVCENLDTALGYLERAAEDGVKLAVLPEMWASSFMADEALSVKAQVDQAEATIQRISADLDMIIVGSNYEFGPDGEIYNTARLVEEGNCVARYRKIHLFSPLAEDRYFQHGTESCVADTSIGKIAVAICYDLRFPELIRKLYVEDAQILAIPAQWPEPRSGHWRILTRARAIENQWHLIATNRCGVECSLATSQDVQYSGNSVIVNPTGDIMASGNGEEGIVQALVDLKEVSIVRRAIPVRKDRKEAVYRKLWDSYLSKNDVLAGHDSEEDDSDV